MEAIQETIGAICNGIQSTRSIPTNSQAGQKSSAAQQPTKTIQTNSQVGQKSQEAQSKEVDINKLAQQAFAELNNCGILRPLKVNIDWREFCGVLWGAYCNEVNKRGCVVNADAKEHVKTISTVLTSENVRLGLLLIGNVGSGKTTMARAIQTAMRYITDKTKDISHRNVPRFDEIVSARQFNHEGFDVYGLHNRTSKGKRSIVCIDDLGLDIVDKQVYGNILQPFCELIELRYQDYEPFIITTNLNLAEIGAKYGERVYDRINEVCTVVPMKHESYRTR